MIPCFATPSVLSVLFAFLSGIRYGKILYIVLPGNFRRALTHDSIGKDKPLCI